MIQIHFTNAVSVNDHKKFVAFCARLYKVAYSRLLSFSQIKIFNT